MRGTHANSLWARSRAGHADERELDTLSIPPSVSAGEFCENLLHLALPHAGSELETAAAALDRLALRLSAATVVYARFDEDPKQARLLLERLENRRATPSPQAQRSLGQPWPGVLASEGPTPRPLLAAAQAGTIQHGSLPPARAGLGTAALARQGHAPGGALPARWGAIGPYLFVPTGPATGDGGALFLGRHPGAPAFSEIDIISATSVAALLRALHERATLLQHADLRDRRQRVVSRTAIGLQNAVSVEQALTTTVAALEEVLGAETISIWLADNPPTAGKPGMTYRFAAGTERRTDGTTKRPTCLGLLARRTLEACAPLQYPDLTRSSLWEANPAEFAAIRAAHTTVLKSAALQLGVIELGFATERTLDADEVHFLESIAKPLAATYTRFEARRGRERASAMLRSTIEQSPWPLLVFDRDGTVLAASQLLWKLTGYEPHRIHTMNAWLTATVRDQAERDRLRERLCADEAVELGDHAVTYADGRVATWNFTLSHIEDPESGRLAFLSAHDVSEQRLAEARMHTTKKLEAIGQMAAGMAHDFKNSLQVIVGYTQLARQRLGEAHPVCAYLDEVLVAAERERMVTSGLLAFSRNTPGKVAAVDLYEVVHQFLEHVRHMIPERIGFDLGLEAGALPPISVDPARLEEILLNLLVNARDAIADVGEVAWHGHLVRAGAQPPEVAGPPTADDMVLLCVRDTGCGMAEDIRDHLFEPFFTTKENGTGLGLATSYATLQRLGGDLRVCSTPGVGTTFGLLLPLATEHEQRVSEPSPVTDPPRGTETILLVEDRQQIRDLARSTLTGLGYRVLAASDGEEGLRVAAASPHAVQLLVTDVIMPRMGGRALARQLRAEIPDLRVIYVTGLSGAELVDEGPGEADGALEKPFAPSQLAVRIREVLDRP